MHEPPKKVNLEWALQYCKLEWSIIPLAPYCKFPPKGETWKDKQIRRATLEELIAQFDQHPNAGIGLVTGKVSGLVVIDLDGAEAVEAFSYRYADAMETIQACSGSGDGLHLYYRYPANVQRIKTCAGELGINVDIRGDGGIVALPPTFHKSGNRYTWGRINPIEDGLSDLMDIPDDLLQNILSLGDGGAKRARTSQAGRATDHGVDLVALGMGVAEGRRNDACARMAGHYARENHGDFDATLEVLLRWNQLNKPPMLEDEVRRTVKSICDAEMAKDGDDHGRRKEDPIEKAIDKLNERFAVITETDKFTVLQRTFDRNFNREDYVLKSKDALFSLNANNLVPVKNGIKTEMVNAASLWIRSKRRKEYAQIVFTPGAPREVRGCYNLWYGMEARPIEGDWSLMQRHLEEVICSGDQELTKWVLCWLARIVQDPGGERPGTAIALKGAQGTGKTAFVKNFGLLFGRHFLHVGQQGHVTGRFNNMLKDKLVVFLDEVTWSKNRDGEASTLKFMITENTISIEDKHVSIINVKNHINLLLASNSRWAVPAAVDERRFCVIQVSDKRRGDHEYFDRLYHLMEHGGREAMLADLLKIDWRQVDLRKIPRTAALAEQASYSAAPLQKWWDDVLYRGYLVYFEGLGPEPKTLDIFDNERHPTELLFQCYVRFCQDRGLREYIEGLNNFSRAISELCPSVARTRMTTGSRQAAMVFPPLQRCREAVDAKLSRKPTWEGSEIVEEQMAA